MKTRYANPANTLVEVTLAPGEAVGTFSCPKDAVSPLVVPITVSPATADGDALLALIKAGAAPAPTPLGAGAGVIAPAGAFVLYKADIWRRCTDDEATKLDGALAQQPVRLRRLFDDATYLLSSDELFAKIQAATTGLLGDARAKVILAPSA